jgi:hypothetical protein
MGSFWKNEPILRGFFAPEMAFLGEMNALLSRTTSALRRIPGFVWGPCCAGKTCRQTTDGPGRFRQAQGDRPALSKRGYNWTGMR